MVTRLAGTFAVTVLGVATRNRYGEETRMTLGTIEGCSWAPSASTEDTDQRAQVVSTGQLYIPATHIAFTAQARIRFPDGREWTIVGEPQWWANPYTGHHPGGVVSLQRVTG